jgi:hypothetical protein
VAHSVTAPLSCPPLSRGKPMMITRWVFVVLGWLFGLQRTRTDYRARAPISRRRARHGSEMNPADDAALAVDPQDLDQKLRRADAGRIAPLLRGLHGLHGRPWDPRRSNGDPRRSWTPGLDRVTSHVIWNSGPRGWSSRSVRPSDRRPHRLQSAEHLRGRPGDACSCLSRQAIAPRPSPTAPT